MRRKRKLKDRIRNNVHIQNIQKITTEFCEQSNIHGVRYFPKGKQHWSERFWWIVAFSVSMCLCSWLIKNTWINWSENPVSMSLAEKRESISSVPFPTLTICPELKTTSSKLNLISMLGLIQIFRKNWQTSLPNLMIKRLETLWQMCKILRRMNLEFKGNATGEWIYDRLAEMAPSLDETMNVCTMQEERKSCNNIFVPIFTERGFCFTFNAMNSREIYTEEMASGMMIVNSNPNVSGWNIETGYSNDQLHSEYPKRIYHAGESAGMFLELSLSKEDLLSEYLCRQLSVGFNIALSVPGEALTFSHEFIRVPLLEEVWIRFGSKLTTTSEGLRSYTPNQRRCYYELERKLQFFRNYTQKNCEAECMANFTKQECGCVRFFMPRIASTPICGGVKIACCDNVTKTFFESNGIVDQSALDRCNCMPACTTIEYDTEIGQSKFDWDLIQKGFGNNESKERSSRVYIFFGDNKIDRVKRFENYTYVDFLADCGGLLGLFLGISLLSIVELVYYFTLRFYLMFYRSRLVTLVAPFPQGHISAIRY